MSNQRLLRAWQPSSLCVFCAHRTAFESRIPFRSQRRIHSTDPRNGGEAVAAAVRNDNTESRETIKRVGTTLEGFGSLLGSGSAPPEPQLPIAPLPSRGRLPRQNPPYERNDVVRLTRGGPGRRDGHAGGPDRLPTNGDQGPKRHRFEHAQKTTVDDGAARSPRNIAGAVRRAGTSTQRESTIARKADPKPYDNAVQAYNPDLTAGWRKFNKRGANKGSREDHAASESGLKDPVAESQASTPVKSPYEGDIRTTQAPLRFVSLVGAPEKTSAPSSPLGGLFNPAHQAPSIFDQLPVQRNSGNNQSQPQSRLRSDRTHGNEVQDLQQQATSSPSETGFRIRKMERLFFRDGLKSWDPQSDSSDYPHTSTPYYPLREQQKHSSEAGQVSNYEDPFAIEEGETTTNDAFEDEATKSYIPTKIDSPQGEAVPAPEPQRSKVRERDQDQEEDWERGKRKKGKGTRRRDDEDDDDFDEELLDRIERKRQRKQERLRHEQEFAVESENKVPTVNLPDHISVVHLANLLGERLEDFTRRLSSLGFDGLAHDHVLSAENAGLIAMECGFEPIVDEVDEMDDLLPQPLPEDMSDLPQRPPVVTIMGHVDHGKTTILDYLRKSSIAAGEYGGITQHIGAFVVPLSSGQTITFLDTPGHAAFLNMRQRGATVTDIVVLVVAADDSVMPQTKEAIKHAKSANVPIIVAINKIDKEEANPQRVKQDLARNGVEVEDFGGDTQVVCVSGKTGLGMQELEETIVTLGEILDHRAPTNGPVEGWVLEASTKDRGRVATILVRRGTLRPGDIIVAGAAWARVRTLRNEAGAEVDDAPPGTPVEVDGWREPPAAGDEVLQAPRESRAAAVADYRAEQLQRRRLTEDMDAINTNRKATAHKRLKIEEAAKAKASGEGEAEDDAFSPEEASEEAAGPAVVNLIVKADVSGSAEAVVHATQPLGNQEIRTRILRSGVGPVSPFDVEHAAAAGGHIVAFNTAVDARVAQLAAEKKVKIVGQNIIYRVVEEVISLLEGMLPPLITKRVDGEAEVAQLFEIKGKGRLRTMIAGCKVRNGAVTRGSRVRVLRGKGIVYDGELTSLKNVKKDVTEMRKNTECGMSFGDWEDFRVGDQVQCYTEVSEKRHL